MLTLSFKDNFSFKYTQKIKLKEAHGWILTMPMFLGNHLVVKYDHKYTNHNLVEIKFAKINYSIVKTNYNLRKLSTLTIV